MRVTDLFPAALDREEELLLAELEGDPGCPCSECKRGIEDEAGRPQTQFPRGK